MKNNSFIVQKSRSCYYCKVDVYCHCDATLEDVGVYVFPNGREIYSSSNYYYYYVRREGYSGIRIRNYHTYTPSSWGIFTCKMPDSEGNMIENSIGVYHTMPSKLPDTTVHIYYFIASAYNTCSILGITCTSYCLNIVLVIISYF